VAFLFAVGAAALLPWLSYQRASREEEQSVSGQKYSQAAPTAPADRVPSGERQKRERPIDPEVERKANLVRSLENRLESVRKEMGNVKLRLEEVIREEQRLEAIWNKPMYAANAERVRKKMAEVKKTHAALNEQWENLTRDQQELIAKLDEARKAGP